MGVCHSTHASDEALSESIVASVGATAPAAIDSSLQFAVDSTTFHSRSGVHYQFKCVAPPPIKSRNPPLSPCDGQFVCCYTPEWIAVTHCYREPHAQLILHRFHFNHKGKLTQVDHTQMPSGTVRIKWKHPNEVTPDIPTSSVVEDAGDSAELVNSNHDRTAQHPNQHIQSTDVNLNTSEQLEATIDAHPNNNVHIEIPSTLSLVHSMVDGVVQEFLIEVGPSLPKNIFSTQQLGSGPMPFRLSLYEPWQVAGTPEYVAHDSDYHTRVRPSLLSRFGDDQAGYIDDILHRMRRTPVVVIHPEEVDPWAIGIFSYERDAKEKEILGQYESEWPSEELWESVKLSFRCDFTRMQKMTLIIPESNIENVYRR